MTFGTPGFAHVPIDKAIAASAALPGLFPPVEIDGEHYVDGALNKTLHASIALDQGVELLLCVNPLVPFDANAAARRRRLTVEKINHGGLPLVLAQTFRAIIHSRMKVGMDSSPTSSATPTGRACAKPRIGKRGGACWSNATRSCRSSPVTASASTSQSSRSQIVRSSSRSPIRGRCSSARPTSRAQRERSRGRSMPSRHGFAMIPQGVMPTDNDARWRRPGTPSGPTIPQF